MLEAIAAIVKALGYAGALTGAGTVIVCVSLAWGLKTPPQLPSSLVRFAGSLLVLTSCATALIFFLRLGGDADTATLDAIFLSPLGVALGLQLIGGLWLALNTERRTGPIGALLILVAFGVVGHSASRGMLTSITIVLHVTAAAWWCGGLWILLFAGRTASPDFHELVGRFSRQAVWVVAALLVAALTTAAQLLEFRLDLALAYEKGLLTKLGLTVLLLSVAGINKLVLTPHLTSQDSSRVWLRRAIMAELLIFTALLSATAYLTTYLSPHGSTNGTHADQSEVQASGPIVIVDPWAPAMPGGASTGAAYLTIVNNQPVEDRLIAASSPWAERVTLHASKVDNGIARMRDLDALPIPGRGQATLQPGVYHLMFEGLYAPLVAGDTLPMTLTFERAGKVEVHLTVLPLGERPAERHRH
ncbi:copper chaperone PCu(A)C [Rhizorhabdus sp. FW153]|uniref:copper chaperone PCu(A)C n=1 Tax=Rhizorhabdus sp. FW153 TaxID=3400216 RepID=UPI003CEC4511